MNTVKKCLFGGALLGAGLSSSAVAGEFEWNFADLSVVGAAGNFQSHNGSGDFDVSSSGYLGSAHASGDADGFSMSALVNDFATSRGGNESYVHLTGAFFQVTEDMSVTVEWDFSNSSNISTVNFDGNILTGSGSLDFELRAFTGYGFSGDIYASPFFGLDDIGSTFSITENSVAVVPVPTAAFAGLGMLAGLGAYRRVRR